MHSYKQKHQAKKRITNRNEIVRAKNDDGVFQNVNPSTFEDDAHSFCWNAFEFISRIAGNRMQKGFTLKHTFAIPCTLGNNLLGWVSKNLYHIKYVIKVFAAYFDMPLCFAQSTHSIFMWLLFNYSWNIFRHRQLFLFEVNKHRLETNFWLWLIRNDGCRKVHISLIFIYCKYSSE